MILKLIFLTVLPSIGSFVFGVLFGRKNTKVVSNVVTGVETITASTASTNSPVSSSKK